MAARLDDGDDDLAEAHEINVTPFIDVMLVLLIIFMVAPPLATVSVPVNLPTSSAEATPRPDKPVFLTVRADRGFAVGDTTVAPEALGPMLDRATAGDRSQRVFLRADRTVPYEDLMAAMDRLRNAGYLKVALVALEQANPK
jgi:biopolymer transport protein ExbD